VRTYLALIRQAWRLFVASRARETAATMALHMLMGATALAIVLSWLAGVTELDAAVVSEQIHRVIGVNAGHMFDTLLERADSSWRVVVPVIGVGAVFVWNVFHVMRHVQRAVNQAVGVRTVVSPKHRPQILVKRFLGTGFVSVAVFGMVVSLSAKTALEVFEYLGVGPVAQSPWAFRAAEFVGALLLATVLFGFVFRMIPDAKMRFSQIWHGAFWAAKLYALVQVGVAFSIVYVGGMSYYGEAAILLVLVAYVYFACVSFLWGTQVMRADLARLGVNPLPSKWAVPAPTTLPDLDDPGDLPEEEFVDGAEPPADDGDKPIPQEPAAE
jgi:membrane protein